MKYGADTGTRCGCGECIYCVVIESCWVVEGAETVARVAVEARSLRVTCNWAAAVDVLAISENLMAMLATMYPALAGPVVKACALLGIWYWVSP